MSEESPSKGKTVKKALKAKASDTASRATKAADSAMKSAKSAQRSASEAASSAYDTVTSGVSQLAKKATKTVREPSKLERVRADALSTPIESSVILKAKETNRSSLAALNEPNNASEWVFYLVFGNNVVIEELTSAGESITQLELSKTRTADGNWGEIYKEHRETATSEGVLKLVEIADYDGPFFQATPHRGVNDDAVLALLHQEVKKVEVNKRKNLAVLWESQVQVASQAATPAQGDASQAVTQTQGDQAGYAYDMPNSEGVLPAEDAVVLSEIARYNPTSLGDLGPDHVVYYHIFDDTVVIDSGTLANLDGVVTHTGETRGVYWTRMKSYAPSMGVISKDAEGNCLVTGIYAQPANEDFTKVQNLVKDVQGVNTVALSDEFSLEAPQ